MTDITLPPMPGERTGKGSWSADEAHAYARAAILADRAEREKDAMRYRWLRAQTEDENSPWCVYPLDGELPDVLDAAIDAAMQEGTK